MSLKEETEYWNGIRQQLKKGTQARIDADKEYFEAKKSQLEEEKEQAALDESVQDIASASVNDVHTVDYKADENLNDFTPLTVGEITGAGSETKENE
jgi:DNA-binding transcriptional regulator GbsR (MarR family)